MASTHVSFPQIQLCIYLKYIPTHSVHTYTIQRFTSKINIFTQKNRENNK